MIIHPDKIFYLSIKGGKLYRLSGTRLIFSAATTLIIVLYKLVKNHGYIPISYQAYGLIRKIFTANYIDLVAVLKIENVLWKIKVTYKI